MTQPYDQNDQNEQPYPLIPSGQPYAQQPYSQDPPAQQYAQPPSYQAMPHYPAHSGIGLTHRRPGSVTAAAVITFIGAGFSVIMGLMLIATGGSVADMFLIGAFSGLIVMLGVIILLLAGLYIWAGVWAIQGRSRTFLLVLTYISAVCAVILMIQALSDTSNDANPAVMVLALAIQAAMIAMLSTPAAKSWFDERQGYIRR